jgi:hypothetical protein
MTNKETIEAPAAKQLKQWATWFADGLEDTAKAIVLFLPNGLNAIYNDLLKRLPLVGKPFFSHKGVEKLIKFCTGISITQELGADVAYFLFRPIGYALGYLLGLLNAGQLAPIYQGKIGKFIGKFTGQTTAGALIGLMISLIFSSSLNMILLATGIGALLGIFAKTIFLFALHSLNEANALAARKNVQKAKEINTRLKVAVREKTKSRILREAQDIIQQMNGPQSQQNLAEFFQNEYEKISQSTYQKIERHFNYLADRACHGDVEALKRLYQLLPKQTDQGTEQTALEKMLDRMFNARAVARIKDEVDSAYDRWQYRFLKMA